jgi:hypothetical protein
MAGGRTAYVAVGNLFAYLCLAATLIIAAWPREGLRGRSWFPSRFGLGSRR